MLGKKIFRRKTVLARDDDNQDNHDTRSISSIDSFKTYHGNIGSLKKRFLKNRFKASSGDLNGDHGSDSESVSEFSTCTQKSKGKFKRILHKFCDKLKKSTLEIDNNEIYQDESFDRSSDSEYMRAGIWRNENNASETVNFNNNTLQQNENVIVNNLDQNAVTSNEVVISYDVSMLEDEERNNCNDIKVVIDSEYCAETRFIQDDTRNSTQFESPQRIVKEELCATAAIDPFSVSINQEAMEGDSGKVCNDHKSDKIAAEEDVKEATDYEKIVEETFHIEWEKEQECEEHSASLHLCENTLDKPNVLEICLEESFVDKLESVYNDSENTMNVFDTNDRKIEESKCDEEVSLKSDNDDEKTETKGSEIMEDDLDKESLHSVCQEIKACTEVLPTVTNENQLSGDSCLCPNEENQALPEQTNDRPDLESVTSDNLINDNEINEAQSTSGYEECEKSAKADVNSEHSESSKTPSITEPIMNACLSPKFEVVYSDYKSPVVLNRQTFSDTSVGENTENNKVDDSIELQEESLKIRETKDGIICVEVTTESQKTVEQQNLEKINGEDSSFHKTIQNVENKDVEAEQIKSDNTISEDHEDHEDNKSTSDRSSTSEHQLAESASKVVPPAVLDNAESDHITEGKLDEYNEDFDEQDCEMKETEQKMYVCQEKPLVLEDNMQVETTNELTDDVCLIGTTQNIESSEEINPSIYGCIKDESSETVLGSRLKNEASDEFHLDVNVTNERFMHVIPEEENESSDDHYDVEIYENAEKKTVTDSHPGSRLDEEKLPLEEFSKHSDDYESHDSEHSKSEMSHHEEDLGDNEKDQSIHQSHDGEEKQEANEILFERETKTPNVLMTGDESRLNEENNEDEETFSTSSDDSIIEPNQRTKTVVGDHESNGKIEKTEKQKINTPVEDKQVLEDEEISIEEKPVILRKSPIDLKKEDPLYSYDETFTEDLPKQHIDDVKSFDEMKGMSYSSIDIMQLHSRLRKSAKKARGKRTPLRTLSERRKSSSRSSFNLKNSIDHSVSETESVASMPPCPSLLQFYKAEMERAASIHTYVQCFSGSSNVEYRIRMRRSYRSPYQMIIRK